jgi:hypothetical protein
MGDWSDANNDEAGMRAFVKLEKEAFNCFNFRPCPRITRVIRQPPAI